MRLTMTVTPKNLLSRDVCSILKKYSEGDMCVLVKVTSKELCSEELLNFVRECRKENGFKKIEIEVELTRDFDEYDIELYVEAISKLNPDEFHIKQAEWLKKPRYKTLKEVQGALEHFAEFREENRHRGYQVFKYNNTRVVFDYVPV